MREKACEIHFALYLRRKVQIVQENLYNTYAGNISFNAAKFKVAFVQMRLP